MRRLLLPLAVTLAAPLLMAPDFPPGDPSGPRGDGCADGCFTPVPGAIDGAAIVGETVIFTCVVHASFEPESCGIDLILADGRGGAKDRTSSDRLSVLSGESVTVDNVVAYRASGGWVEAVY